jgi:GntR family transcriptional repressor for pyruvate dehydrogenase complex
VDSDYRIERKTIVYQAMDKIKQLIANGKFTVNERIPKEAELSQMFGTGRSTIREAIKIFNYLGVLESIPSKGTFVCDRSRISSEALAWSVLLGHDELDDLLELREIMEQRGLQRLFELLSDNRELADAYISKLEAHVENLRQAIRDSSEGDLLNATFGFHKSIVEITDNALFVSFYETLRSFMFNAAIYNLRTTEHSQILEEHAQIVAAIKNENGEEALSKYKDHMDSISRKISTKFNKLVNIKL